MSSRLRCTVATVSLLAASSIIYSSNATSVHMQDVSASTLYRAQQAADVLAFCEFLPAAGTFPFEDLWQSGNSIETLSNLMLLLADTPNAQRYAALLNDAYLRVAPIADNCFDDHQWWLLAWIRAYQATQVQLYIERAAQIFDFIVDQGWDDKVCGGGVLWCPPTANPYKNAVTNELFLTSAMEMHPYANITGKSSDYYLNWALKEWTWLEGSGMINSQHLVNDGLDSTTCLNNNQTTWTYNQGVFLDGLSLLASATSNTTILQVAMNVATATMNYLTDSQGILTEPCTPPCDGDQHIFKGVFVRHLGIMLNLPIVLNGGSTTAAFLAQGNAFLQTNAAANINDNSCNNTMMYGFEWAGPTCSNEGVSTLSAGVDLLIAASMTVASSSQPLPNMGGFIPLGLGMCIDNLNNTFPSCVTSTAPGSASLTEPECVSSLTSISGGVAYEFAPNCNLGTTCTIRSPSLKSQGDCPAAPSKVTWTFVPGSGGATGVTTTIPSAANPYSLCVVKGT